MSTYKFEQIYITYKDLLYRIIFTYVKNFEDAQDILQDTFVKLHDNHSKWESEEHIKRWLIRVAVNLSKNHVTSFWNRNRSVIPEEMDISDTVFDSKERCKEVWESILQLPQKCKAVIYLHYYEGYACKELAAIFGISESAVKMRLKKGRELLKLELEN